MAIRVYDTLTRTKHPFEPVRPGKVGIYLCGPTVYKPSHIGHMVGPVIFDAVKRYLRYSGYEVTLVINITDVDDKLIAESHARDMPMPVLAEEMTADYLRNLEAMGVDTVDHFPKATEHMGAIVAFIEGLIEQGFAYASDGDVYFEVARDAEYGKLSGRSLEALQGEGGSTADRKRSIADFALWKSAKPGEPAWDSPWGKGRPGWHIECSVMSARLLGETFDIHAGGLDLMFPHHENEIAQSECRHGCPQAKYWMHNGLMQATDEVGKLGGRATRNAEPEAGDQAGQEAGKMGKSKGASAFRDLLGQFAGETIRFFLLGTHYRSPITYGIERLEEIERSLETFYRFFERYERVAGGSFYDLAAPKSRKGGDFEPGDDDAVLGEVHELRERFLEAMDDDFNTGAAVAMLFDMLRTLNKFIDTADLEDSGKGDAAKLATLTRGTTALRELAATLGLFRSPPTAAGGGKSDALVAGLMQLVLDIRAASRKNKDFATADRIRDTLTELGITLEDRPDGTGWRV